MDKLIIFTDGGARNNPGPAGVGVVIYNDKKIIIQEYCEYIGHKTNNQAEYTALIKALELADGKSKKLEFYLDSLLVVNQAKGIFKVKNGEIRELLLKVKTLEQNFDEISYNFVPREKNTHADKMVNKAIDDYLLKSGK